MGGRQILYAGKSLSWVYRDREGWAGSAIVKVCFRRFPYPLLQPERQQHVDEQVEMMEL